MLWQLSPRSAHVHYHFIINHYLLLCSLLSDALFYLSLTTTYIVSSSTISNHHTTYPVHCTLHVHCSPTPHPVIPCPMGWPGLMRMFESEVLRQHAVVQNLRSDHPTQCSVHVMDFVARFGAIFAADWESSRTANEEQHCAQFDEGWVGPSGVQGSDCDQMAAPGESAPLETITGVAPWSASFQVQCC